VATNALVSGGTSARDRRIYAPRQAVALMAAGKETGQGGVVYAQLSEFLQVQTSAPSFSPAFRGTIIGGQPGQPKLPSGPTQPMGARPHRGYPTFPAVSRYFVPKTENRWPLTAGFRSDAQSVHGSRTIMVADLSELFMHVPVDSEHEAYRRAIQEENVLGKKTASTRLWAYTKLRELYGLDPRLPVFRALRLLWAADSEGRPLLALLAATARDSLLRSTMGAVIEIPVGQELTRERIQEAVVAARGDRFSATTMKSLLANVTSSWTQSGHLAPRGRIRTAPPTGTSAVALALFLGYLTGARGLMLFATPWTALLGLPESRLQDMAREASRRGWLTYRGIGDVVDITFERLLTAADVAALAAVS
jgi:hypothetical protein